jgi:catechol 2,3-dioxygenase-like lactoylglutathione lyase family enzyme
MDLRLEVVILPVTDVDKAKHFYKTGLGCRLDADVSPREGYHIVQVTRPGRPARSSSATA